jgi:hypothetical protein
VETTLRLKTGSCRGAKRIWSADMLSTIERDEQAGGVKLPNPLAVGDGAELDTGAACPP